jgi:hypothetical protein
MVHKFGVDVGKLNPIKVMTADKDIVDLQGWTIQKGSKMFVMKDAVLISPSEGKVRFLVVRIDNGTGVLDMMPETAIKMKA